MLDVINLALPFFGLIFLGLACGKLKQIPDTGLAWMNFFLIYVSLPCLFYRVLAQTPLEQLNNPPFIVATMLATGAMFALAFLIGWLFRRHMGEATIAGLSGAYGNIGYMGPGLALATLGPAANVPVALIFCFDTLLLFAPGAVPDDARRSAPRKHRGDRARGGQAHRAASLHHRDRARRRVGGDPFRAAGRARPADAVPAERRGALRAVRARRHGGVAADPEDALGGAVHHHGEADRCIRSWCWCCSRGSARSTRRGSNRRADGRVAAGAERVHHGAAIRYLGGAGVRLGAVRDLRVGGDADHDHVAGEDAACCPQRSGD